MYTELATSGVLCTQFCVPCLIMCDLHCPKRDKIHKACDIRCVVHTVLCAVLIMCDLYCW